MTRRLGEASLDSELTFYFELIGYSLDTTTRYNLNSRRMPCSVNFAM